MNFITDIHKDFYPPPAFISIRSVWYFLFFLVCVVLATEKNHSVKTDPRGTLLVSEALIRHGTIKMDSYGPDFLERYGYVFYKKNDHYYYYFPIGTSIVSVPIVAIGEVFGISPVKHEPILQMVVVSIAALAIFYLLFKIATLFLKPRESLLLVGLCWFGSALASVVGTGLWSHDFAIVFASAAIYLVLKSALQNTGGNYLLIAACLFFAYLCRPTLSLLAPFLLIYYFLHNRANAIKAALVLALISAGFVVWSYHEFSQPLPDYYLPQRIEGANVLLALYGNTFSPARGLYIYSPFLLLPLFCSFFFAFKHRAFRAVLIIGFAWPLVHLITISRFPHWWAGYSFGSRFMADVLPGLFVALFFSLKLMGSWRPRAYIFLIATGAFSIYVNTYQGLYNVYTALWNVTPSVDKYPQYLFDWRYPQFLHNETRHERRLLEFENRRLSFFPGKFDIGYDAPSVEYSGFYPPEPPLRWTAGKHATITFDLESDEKFVGELQLLADFLSSERLIIAINGNSILTRDYFGGGLEIRFNFDPKFLHAGKNSIDFYLPDAHRPPPPDIRILGMALHQLLLR
jgi:hypothetical protein